MYEVPHYAIYRDIDEDDALLTSKNSETCVEKDKKNKYSNMV